MANSTSNMRRTSLIAHILPDDRPVTAIQIIENIDKCPRGFNVVSRTHDQDQDADLRETSIFKSSSARYLCISKTEGLPGFVVQELVVLNDKINPPAGFSLLNKTADSEQKAWRKKQICYKLVKKGDVKTAITDIIVCGRLKKAPTGFSLAGELNGVTVCYKMGNVQSPQSNGDLNVPPELPPRPMKSMNTNVRDPDNNDDISSGLVGPTRPAPRPPATVKSQLSTQTLNNTAYNGLEGVPFDVNPKILNSTNVNRFKLPMVKAQTMSQILKNYDYSFTLERHT